MSTPGIKRGTAEFLNSQRTSKMCLKRCPERASPGKRPHSKPGPMQGIARSCAPDLHLRGDLMSHWKEMTQRELGRLALRSDEQEEILAELSGHLEETYEGLLRQGASQEDAVRWA